MRTTSARLLLGLLGLLGLGLARPTPAEVWYGGQLGFSFDQRNQWYPGADSSFRSYWFTGGAYLGASFFSPGTLSLSGSADYRGYRAVGGSSSDGLNYGLRLNALERTPVHLAASINRETVDFASDSSRTRTGTTRQESVAGSAALVFDGLPSLSATAWNTTFSNQAVGSPAVKSDTTGMNMEAAQTVDWANYRLNYNTAWSSGDYAETNYQNHFFAFRTLAHPSTDVTASVDANYFLRLPTLSSALNPRIDTQTLTTWLQVGGPLGTTTGGGGYSYSSSLFEVPGEQPRESIAHSLNAYADRQLNAEWAVNVDAGASASETRASGLDQRATGEQVSATFRWARQVDRLALNGTVGAGLGAIQLASGPDPVAWNVNASGGVSRPVSTWLVSSYLIASYDSNTGAAAGRRLRLLGNATANGSPFGWTLDSLLNLGYAFTDSPTFGSKRTVNSRLTVQARRGGLLLSLDAGLTDDLSDVLVPVSGPSLGTAPGTYNTQSRYVLATATIPTFQSLFLSLTARHLEFTSPGRPTQWESGGTLTASYVIGAIQFSLLDSVTTGGGGAGNTGTQNLLFFSVTRSFGR
jgi:hypothetical protein